MKKILLLFLILTNTNISANEKENLKILLSNLDGFSSDFYQNVIDEEGNIIMEGKGELLFKKPNKFSWKSTEPDEELLLSNGKELLHYSPFLEQVTIYNTENKMITTPFALLISNEEDVWNNFNITKINDNYLIESKSSVYANMEKLLINFKNKILNKITIIDNTKQKIVYNLSNQNINKDLKYDFTFDVPENIIVDDQR